MESVFLKLLNMSIAAGWLVLAVVALRFLLKKAPKTIRCVLWALVGIRLICPFSFESALSLIPSAETVSPDILYSQVPTIHTGIGSLNRAVNPIISESLAPTASASVNPLQVMTITASMVWITGVAILLTYAAISYLRLRRRVSMAIRMRDNLWLCDQVSSPFILGFFKPHIYLPCDMDERHLAHVVAHENAHIRRHDHWWKLIGFTLLTVYWFNPLMWLAYVLLCRDIELACDEKVVKEMGTAGKKAYSEALLSCSVTQRMITACPLAFGEVGVKERIRNVLNYKKPAFWIIVAAATACVVLAVCFLTNPKVYAQELKVNGVLYSQQGENISDLPNGSTELGTLDRVYHRTVEHPAEDYAATNIDEKYAGCPIYQSGNAEDTVYLYDYAGFYIPYVMTAGDTVDFSSSSGHVAGSSVLTLSDVLKLSQKGEALSWDDFDSYQYMETGSGLYIRVYEIDSIFSVWIGGGLTSEKPMYIYLKANTGTDNSIDIRTEDVSVFIGAHKEALLDAAVSAAILDHNGGKYGDNDFACESHVALGTLPGKRWDEVSNSTIPTVEVYLMALYQEYQYSGDSFSNTGGSHIPCVLTFDDTEAGYILTDYWEPRDGSYYKPDIEKRFHGLDAATIANALDTQRYIEVQQKECDEKAAQYLAGLTQNGMMGSLDSEPIRVYVFEESEDVVKPSVALYENEEFSFTFSAISNYWGHGTYEINDNHMILKTDDGSYQYVFEMVSDALVFDADDSSSQTWFSGIYDGAVFK